LIKKIFNNTPIGSLGKSLVDNLFTENVQPVYGSIVHCSLFGAEHTGIYVDNNQIVELLGTGEIRLSSPHQFIQGTNALSIYVACNKKRVLSYQPAADRAIEMIGKSRKYHLLKDNCHQFTSGCLLNEFNNDYNYFYSLEKLISEKVNEGKNIKWNVWNKY
jgi:hypothetical protein